MRCELNRILDIPQDSVNFLLFADWVKDLHVASSQRTTEAREQNRRESIWDERVRKREQVMEAVESIHGRGKNGAGCRATQAWVGGPIEGVM